MNFEVLWLFAKIFLTKCYFPPIHKSFLPRKFPAIRYISQSFSSGMPYFQTTATKMMTVYACNYIPQKNAQILDCSLGSEKRTVETLFLCSKCSSLSHFKPGAHSEHTTYMGQDCQGMHVEGNGFCLPVAHFSQSKLAVFWGGSVVVAVLYCEVSVCGYLVLTSSQS